MLQTPRFLILSIALLLSFQISGQIKRNIPIYDDFGIDSFASIEDKVDALVKLMTLEGKIGQMYQVRHFSDISVEDIATKFIGSVIHSQGSSPGEGAAGWPSLQLEGIKENFIILGLNHLDILMINLVRIFGIVQISL